MPSGLKVTNELFDQLKNELNYSDPLTVAIKNHLSVKTILMIKGSNSFSDYEAQKRAQHPPTKFSVPKRLDIIEDKLDKLIEASRQNRLF
jgi:hypothetical protein